LGSYVIINLALADYPIAIVELGCLIAVLISLNIYLNKGQTQLATNLTSIVLVIMGIHNFNTGGFYPSGLFWVFVITAILFYIHGNKAVKWIVVMHFGIIFLILLHLLGIKLLPYEAFTLCTFYIALTIISIFTYLYNKTIDTSLTSLKTTGFELEDALLNLSFEETKIKSFTKEIESREKELHEFHKSLLERENRLTEIKNQVLELQKKKSKTIDKS
jgi:hypothetical protein